MTNIEAIEIIQKEKAYMDSHAGRAQSEAFQMAINALEENEQYKALGTVEELMVAKEKQIAKKPKTDDRYVMYICPCCNDFIKVSHNCCQNCGQELDWSDEE